MPELKIHKPGWKPSFWQAEHFTNSPTWDYKLCRCENNGDYCLYCNFIQAALDEPETQENDLKPEGAWW